MAVHNFRLRKRDAVTQPSQHTGAGIDTLIGGAGNVNSATDTITENAGGGSDTVSSSVTFSLGANVEKLTLSGTNPTNGTGNGLNNVITGNVAANTVNGGDGNDTFKSGGGDDSVTGGNGDDSLDGTGALLGVGDKDTLTGSADADVFVLGVAAGRYYDDGNAGTGGVADYAYVADLSRAEGDKLQLKGTAADYVLGTNPIASLTGKGLFFDSDNSGTKTANDELIAVVQNTGVSLTLDVTYVA